MVDVLKFIIETLTANSNLRNFILFDNYKNNKHAMQEKDSIVLLQVDNTMWSLALFFSNNCPWRSSIFRGIFSGQWEPEEG